MFGVMRQSTRHQFTYTRLQFVRVNSRLVIDALLHSSRNICTIMRRYVYEIQFQSGTLDEKKKISCCIYFLEKLHQYCFKSLIFCFAFVFENLVLFQR